MSNYIQQNSNRCKRYTCKTNKQCQKKMCTTYRHQSYDAPTFGQVVTNKGPTSCGVQQNCNKADLNFQQYVINQQNLYALMRRKPELFPITSWTKMNGLTPPQQRMYSNMWYRQFGTSQALPVNDDWGGFYLVGSEVPYTN
jgi:hypothetical protein